MRPLTTPEPEKSEKNFTTGVDRFHQDADLTETAL